MKYFWLLLVSWVALASARAAESTPERKPELSWNPRTGRLDARIEGWPLAQTLARLSRVTGWQVFCEPGAQRRVASTFTALPLREALPLLLGDFSFSLVSRTNGPPQLFIYSTSVESATSAIGAHDDQAPGPIGNELILALKPGGTNRIEDLAKALGATVAGRLDELGAYRLVFPNDAAADAAKQTLAGLEDLASVENNQRIGSPEPLQQPAGTQVPAINLKPKVVGDKDRIIVGVVDMPVQSLGAAHDALVLKSIDIVPGAADPATVSHGTAMAETVLRGVTMVESKSEYTPVRILPVNVYGSSETTTSWDVARGINAALANGATVINLSLGSEQASPWMQTLIANATRDGAIFVGSAGNTPVTEPTFPAAYPEVIAVTAGNSRGEIASYANRGSFVDVMAPGNSLVRFGGQSYLVSGTSPAAAYVSGIAGALRGIPGNTPDSIRAKIQKQLGYQPGK